MGTIITTISLPNELMTYAEEKKVKLSHLVQNTLKDMMENDKASNLMVGELRRKIAFLQETLNKQRDFLESKGLMEKFLENV